MKSQTMAATAARRKRKWYDIWFWCFMTALVVLVLAGAVFEQLFWWSVMASGILWGVGLVVELLCSWRQERALSRHGEEEAPTDVLTATTSSNVTGDKG